MTEPITLPAPPVAAPIHTEKEFHGVVLTDDYAWLRDKENPEVTQYLDAENAYAEAATAALAPLREQLYDEMLSHIKQTDVSVPYRDGAWWYYNRTEEGLQYAIHCRKRGTPEGPEDRAPEEVILDGNLMSAGLPFFAIGAIDISDDGRWLAYTVDTTGFRQYTLKIKDLESGETLVGSVERVGSVTWAADNFNLFYSVEDDEQKRQYQLYRHMRGTPYAADALVFEESDERFNIGAGRTRDGQYLILESASHTTSECHFLPAAEPEGEFRVICPRQDEPRQLRPSRRPVR